MSNTVIYHEAFFLMGGFPVSPLNILVYLFSRFHFKYAYIKKYEKGLLVNSMNIDLLNYREISANVESLKNISVI